MAIGYPQSNNPAPLNGNHCVCVGGGGYNVLKNALSHSRGKHYVNALP